MTFGAAERSGPLIGGLHHVGHLVRDIEEAAAFYRRLGLVVPVPEFPVLPAISGQRAPVLSAGNAHIQFGANFVELATVVPDFANRPPAGAEIVMLRVPDVAVPRIRQQLESAATRLADALQRFEGVHRRGVRLLSSRQRNSAQATRPPAGNEWRRQHSCPADAIHRTVRSLRRHRSGASVRHGYRALPYARCRNWTGHDHDRGGGDPSSTPRT